MGPYNSALIAALLFLLWGTAIEERRNRAPVAVSIAAPLLRCAAVDERAPQKNKNYEFSVFIAAIYCGGRSCLLKGCRSMAESIAEVVVLSPQ